MNHTRLLLLLALPEPIRRVYFDTLRSHFPELIVDMVDHHSKVGPVIEQTDILITFGPMLADHVIEQATRLKWIQALGTGVDGVIDRPALRPDTIVTNMRGVQGDAMSEAAFLSMLALARDLPRSLDRQARCLWERFPARLLKGRTVGILGVGAIAENLAPKCKAFGMRVVGISSGLREVAGIDIMRPREALAQAVADLDFLVLLTPYSIATRGMVNAPVLAAMKRDAYLVNLARGGVLDEEALLAALAEGRLAGAALDVFSEEPLPADSPIWHAPRLIVTQHQGGFHDRYAAEVLPTVEANLRRFLAGDTRLINLVSR